MQKIALNARFYSHRPTGMQRYAIELARRFGESLIPIRPKSPLRGSAGHLWEQLYLPAAVGGNLLWSPNNTGPLAVRNQVCTFHDLIPIERPEWFTRAFAAWYRILLPQLARKAQHLIAISEFTRRRIIELFNVPESKVSVVLNGVDQGFAPAAPALIQEAREALHIPTPHYLLCVGSLEPRKNTERLIRAWSIAQAKVPDDISLVIAGGGGSKLVFAGEPVTAMAPRTHLTGYVPEKYLSALYSGAVAMLYPSLYEGFGLPPLEAMACGCPVITSNTTSLPEVTGDAALLVDPEDADAIAAAIIRIVDNHGLRVSLHTKGMKRAAQLSWDESARQTWEILQAQAAH